VKYTDKLKQFGKTVRLGQTARIIDVPANPEGKDLGIFQDVHELALRTDLSDVDRKREFGKQLSDAGREYYGTAIREFLRRLVEDLSGNVRLVNEHKADWLKRNLPIGSDAIVNHVAQYFALKYAVGMLPIVQDITGFTSDDVDTSIAYVWRLYLVEKGDYVAPTPNLDEGIEQLRQYCKAHPELLGDIAGEPVYMIAPDDFVNRALNGYDANDIAVLLRDRNYLLSTTDATHVRLQRKVRVDAKHTRYVYAIRAGFTESPA
jgi:hypothetical protein